MEAIMSSTKQVTKVVKDVDKMFSKIIINGKAYYTKKAKETKK